MNSFNSPYLSVTHDPCLNAIVATWHGYVSASEALTGFENIHRLFRHHKAEYVLSDLREHEGGFHNIQGWLQEEYLPQMVAAGYAACANIMPEEFLACISLNDFEDKQGGVVPLRVFDEMEAARQWLGSLSPLHRQPAGLLARA